LSGLCTKKRLKFNLKQIDGSIGDDELELINTFFISEETMDDLIRYKDISD
jgi:hypothetical protein